MNKKSIFRASLIIALLVGIIVCITGVQNPPIAAASDLDSLQRSSAARNLYVDGINGSDNTGDGSLQKPWKTIKKAVYKLKPGDVLSIAAGIYKERIILTKSGTADSRIIIGPSGNGEVIIDASPVIEGWAPYTDTIYKAICAFKPRAVVVNEQPIFPAFSLTDIKEGEWYYDSLQTTLYLYPSGGVRPTASNVGVVSSNDYQDGISFNPASYVTLYGLTIKYAGGRGITILGDYNEINGCNVKFNGHTGINVWHNSTIKSTDTLIAGNNIYHNFLKNWPRGRFKWCCWGGGTISNGTPNTKFISNISHKNGGEGILAYAGPGGTVFKNNISFDNWSVNIYIDNQPNVIVDGNIVFCSEPDRHDLYHNGDTDPGDNRNFRRLRAEGIVIADEGYKLTPPANSNNIKITNNIVSGCRKGISHAGGTTGSGLKNSVVSNNIIIVPDAKGIGENFIGINVRYNDGNNVNSIFENNLIYATNLYTYLLYLGTMPKVTTNITFQELTFKGNTWYHAGNPKPFHVGPDYHTTYDVDFNKWHSICVNKCINDKYANITEKIKPILSRIAAIKAIYK